MRILGLSAYYHDSAAALVVDGRIEYAAQEERFTREKHDPAFPHNAIRVCLELGESRPAISTSSPSTTSRFSSSSGCSKPISRLRPEAFSPFRRRCRCGSRRSCFQKSLLVKELEAVGCQASTGKPKLLFSEHHLSHAASAFFPSPFERAAVLTMDGVGEWTTTSLALGNGNDLEVIREIHFPHSLGLLYSAFTYYTGFKVNSGEYKVMGLAPYGAAEVRRMSSSST